MKTLRTLAAATISFAIILAQAPPPARAATTWDVRAASIIPSSSDSFSTDAFRQSVRDFKSIGGNYVNLIIPYYQSNVFASDIARGTKTPTDASLISAIDYIHSLGMHVELSVYLESRGGEWRALIAASDRDAWFAAYGAVLHHYAVLGQAHGVELMQLGAELISMASNAQNPDNQARWEKMIADLRTVYSGKLTYSANRSQNNWSAEVMNIGFWPKLDYIGISAYYELHGDGSVSSLESGWESIDGYDVKAASDRFGKPVIFSEVGYRSVQYAHDSPWNAGMGGPYDPQEQVNDFEALFGYWMGGDHPYLRGMNLWWWSPDPNYGGAGNTDYTPQGKPALATFTKWWVAGQSATPQGFKSSGSANPAAPGSAGTPVTLSAAVSGSGLYGGVVDLEVIQNGAKVFQQVWTGQDFASNETRQYEASWTPSAPGTYTLKIGVFTSNWASLVNWNDSAATIRVGGGAAPPPGGTIDFWWPIDGVHMTGLQPFKGLLQGADVSSYRMYWKVGNGNLVPMDTDMSGWPHKEALVDLSGWNWEGSGPYTITFVAQDLAGNTIAQKSVQIWIP